MKQGADVQSNDVATLPWLAPVLERALALRGHAVLLHGGLGRGLATLAMGLAEARLCSHGEQRLRPCGQCADCLLLRAKTHPDLHVLVPEALQASMGLGSSDEEGRERATKPSHDIRVEAVRQAIEWGTRSSARGRGKVLLVHPASNMNAVAANALLKTLEEPPGSLQLVLTARAPADLLPTLASRCQHLHVPRVDERLASQWLEGQGIGNAEALLRAAGGEPLDALTMTQLGVTADAWKAVPRAVRQGQSNVFAGWTLPAVVDAMHKLCHDAMAVAAGASPRYFDASSMEHAPAWTVLRVWSMELSQWARTAEHPWQLALAVDALVSSAHKVWQSDAWSQPPSVRNVAGRDSHPRQRAP